MKGVFIMKKKVLVMMLAGCMLFSATACGTADKENSGEAGSTAVTMEETEKDAKTDERPEETDEAVSGSLESDDIGKTDGGSIVNDGEADPKTAEIRDFVQDETDLISEDESSTESVINEEDMDTSASPEETPVQIMSVEDGFGVELEENEEGAW